MVLAIDKLKTWKVKKLITQKTLAQLLGKTQPYVSMLIGGKITTVPDSVKQKINEVTNGAVKVSDWFKESK